MKYNPEDWGCLIDVKTNEPFAHWSGCWVKESGKMNGRGGEIVLHLDSSVYKKLLHSKKGLKIVNQIYQSEQSQFTEQDLKGLIFKCVLCGELIGFAKIVQGHVIDMTPDRGYATIDIDKLDNFQVMQAVTKEK